MLLWTERPEFEKGMARLRLVDLFCGCGGLTLGIAQAATAAGVGLDVTLAVDREQVALDTYRENFPKAGAETGDVAALFDGPLGAKATKAERATLKKAGAVDILVGGPPCQGHSSLNNWTRGKDPKNLLYLRMVRAAAVLQPKLLVIENVPSVVNDHNKVVKAAEIHLRGIGYTVASAIVDLRPLGVSQLRRRHVLVAMAGGLRDAGDVLVEVSAPETKLQPTLRDAIGDLVQPAGTTPFDTAPKPSAKNIKRMNYLLTEEIYDLPNHLRPTCHQDDHSYKSMYGRLSWDKPAQTITSGYGSIGQGRYMHPDKPRALTPHEAARLQGFPDYFRFDGVQLRSDLATLIGNAVPPALSRTLLATLVKELAESGDRG